MPKNSSRKTGQMTERKGFFRKIKQSLEKTLKSNKKNSKIQTKPGDAKVEIKTEIENKTRGPSNEVTLVEKNEKTVTLETKEPLLEIALVEKEEKPESLQLEESLVERDDKLESLEPEKHSIEIALNDEQTEKLEPFETRTSSPYNLRKSISLSQSTISTLDEIPKIAKKPLPAQLIPYEASDEDIYMESFPANTYDEEQILFKPAYKYLGIYETDPDEYIERYETELIEFSEFPEFLQTLPPPPSYLDISFSEYD
jgi:hypothetical protein